MLLLRTPNQDAVRRFLSGQADQSFSYSEVGASLHASAPGYTVDHNRIELGRGADTFVRAVEALRRWEMFNLGWIQLYWPEAPVAVGTVVAVLARHLGFYSLNACRIVYVVDEEGPPRRYGFAYGTLPDHAEQGEERFTIEWQSDDSIWYDILAFSRPNQLLARLGYPMTRILQKRFAQDSKQAMRRAVLTGFP
jgi:uncharacterized protein (UPF0548 family)